MAGTVNKVILLGHLGKDPETRTFENGGVVCNFTIATSESYYDKEKNQRIDQLPDWHNIRINKPGLAKVAQQYLKKGSQVYVEGKIRTRQYKTKEGETRFITEIYVDEMTLLGGKRDAGTGPAEQPMSQVDDPPPPPMPEDDLPF
jgi:single-strand DNA-binding protein